MLHRFTNILGGIHTGTKLTATTLVALATSTVLLTGCSDEPEVPTITLPKPTKVAPKADTEAPVAAGDFDFTAWSKESVTQQSTAPNVLLSVIGLTSNQSHQKTLDYHGNPASVYKLRDDNIVFFNMIDSENLLEINWFKTNAEDTMEMQAMGTENAKKAHAAARSMFGDEGGKLVQQIMTSANGKSTVNLGNRLVNADCQQFFCRIVATKNDSATQ